MIADSPASFLIQNATIVTINRAFEVICGDVLIEHGKISNIGKLDPVAGIPTENFHGDFLLPGFVQAHIHLCQTLFRHEAEDRTLLTWLRERIWPLEGAHSPATLGVSARLGISELLLGGTTCLLDMGTVHHQDAIFEVVRNSGIRAALGKAMMDAGDGVPASLLETTQSSIDESLRLAAEIHGQDDDRLRYAFAPRFVLSCTRELQQEVGRCSEKFGYLIHTHSSEQVEEVEIVQKLTGQRNVHTLHDFGMTGPRSIFAHGVHLDDAERARLSQTGTAICHCPASNLKLGSGIANVRKLLDAGVKVGIGADGAPCNNALDALFEIRLAKMLAAVADKPGSLSAREILRIATLGGAESLGWQDRIGSIEIGKDADIIRMCRTDFRTGLQHDAHDEIVCAGNRDLVRDVWVKGRRLVKAKELLTDDASELPSAGRAALNDVLGRADLR